MSHRQPPEDRAPGLRFMAWVLGWMAAVYVVWRVLLAVVT